MKKYLVVGFPKESVEVIPSTWLIYTETCYWPNGKEINLQTMIVNCVLPLETWSQVDIKIYGGSSSFVKAKSKSKECEYMSNLERDSSDDNLNKKRLKRVPIRYQNESEIEEIESQSLLGRNNEMNLLKKREKTQPSQAFTLPKPTSVIPAKVIPRVSAASKTNEPGSFSEFLSATSAHEKTTLEKILKLLEEQKSEIKFLRKEVQKLRDIVQLKLNVEENPQVSAVISGIITEYFDNLPLWTMDNLQALEWDITSDGSKATSLARFLCRGGGFNNMNSLTLLIMKRLLKRDVTMQFSFEGKQAKQKFSDLNLLNVVIASVKMKYGEAETTTICSRIGRILAGSSDWDRNRTGGKRKQMVEDFDIDKDV